MLDGRGAEPSGVVPRASVGVVEWHWRLRSGSVSMAGGSQSRGALVGGSVMAHALADSAGDGHEPDGDILEPDGCNDQSVEQLVVPEYLR